MSNSLDPDQARRIVGPDLGPNCLPRLSADDTGRQRVKMVFESLTGLLVLWIWVVYIKLPCISDIPVNNKDIQFSCELFGKFLT